MIETLIAKTFRDRDMAHVQHFKTGSYAEHAALGEFYAGLMEAMDVLVEAWIGMFGKFGELPEVEKEEFSIDYLRECADWIEVNRKEIAGESDAVANLVDGVTAVYLKAIYKLENLK